MIGIRECIDGTELQKLLKKHENFVGAEVLKRIQFYINLFNTLEFLQAHPGTHAATIIQKIKIAPLHHTQYLSFVGFITLKPNKFNGAKFLELKKLNYFAPDMQNFTLLSGLLTELKSRAISIISLDLTRGLVRNTNYYIAVQAKFAPLGILLNKIFDYTWFSNQQPESTWGAYQLTKGLGMRVCAYCNRQYTFTLSKGKKKVTRPELDHFLPQFENPLLRLSFFNLIPSCTICNGDCKGDVSFNYTDYLSPYEDNLNHKLLSYDYLPTSYSGAVGDSEDIRIFVKSPGVKLSQNMLAKVNGNIRIFHYNLIINEHRDVVQEIIKKRVLSNDTYLKMITDMFPAARLTIDEAYRMAYGNFFKEKEFNKRSLAKLTKDIAVEIGAVKKYKP